MEEGEEGAEEPSDVDQAMDEEERAPSPLLGQFEKFPEFIEIELKPQTGSLVSSGLLTGYNKYALNEVLD